MFVLFGVSVNSIADVITNTIQDPGFEMLSGNLPDSDSTPWYTVDENGDPSCITVTNAAHNGTKSVKFNYYYDEVYLIQNTGHQLESGQNYELSMWMMINEQSPNAAHTNISSITMSVWICDTVDGTYEYLTGQAGNLPTVPGEWQKFTKTFSVGPGHNGYYVQVRFAKPNVLTDYKIYLDDTSLGIIQNPPIDEIGDISMEVVDGSNVVISWTGESVGTYAVQYTSNLALGSWSNLAENIPGVSGVMSVTGSISSLQCFYRTIGE